MGEYVVITTDENGNEHESWVAPNLHNREAFQKHADRMNTWTHKMMESACAGGEMSPDWHDGKMPNSHYIVSFRVVK